MSRRCVKECNKTLGVTLSRGSCTILKEICDSAQNNEKIGMGLIKLQEAINCSPSQVGLTNDKVICSGLSLLSVIKSAFDVKSLCDNISPEVCERANTLNIISISPASNYDEKSKESTMDIFVELHDPTTDIHYRVYTVIGKDKSTSDKVRPLRNKSDISDDTL